MSDSKYKYNSWPLGKIPKELQRPELEQIKELGYNWNDPREVIDMFEKKMAEFSGSKYAVATDCCTHGIFLTLKYLKHLREFPETFKIPLRTYVSVPMQIIEAGAQLELEDIEWSGNYQLKPSRIWDGAGRYTKDMYVGGNALQIISFQIKKRIPIGKGGMILTNDKKAYDWLKLASYDGRDLTLPYTDENHIKMMGYHMYMTPEDAARGIILMDNTPNVNEDSHDHTRYPSLTFTLKNLL